MRPSPGSRGQFLGCILGQAAGDAVAAPFEGLTSEDIWFGFGQPLDLVRRPDEEVLYYTDDTEMLIGVAEVLLEHGTIDEASLVKAFARNYHPERGYGRGTRRLLEAVLAGEDWEALAEGQFPGGSLGNGAAMRVAPVGLFFAADIDRVAEQARRSAWPTHRHPVGIDGAVILAVAVALSLRGPPLDRRAFYDTLRRYATTEEFTWALDVAAGLRARDRLDVLGNSLEAHRSVATAIACFTVTRGDYELAVSRALSLGNDTDTLAAMAGALCGAHAGIDAVPVHLLARLEDGPRGRAYLTRLAEGLYERRVPV